MSTPYNYLGVSPLSMKVGAGGVAKDTLVKLLTTADETVVASAGITDETFGVAQTTQSAGDQVSVQTYGVARVIASAAITAGDKLMFATGAKVATASGATAKVVGVALEAATADGQVIKAFLRTPALMALGA